MPAKKTAKKNKTAKKTAKKTPKCATGSHRVNGKCKTLKPKCKTGYHRPAPTKRCEKI
jgi:hypothetical protein